jgi:hypothetical protein
MRWVAYILELGWATGSSGGSHRNFRSNEIRPLGLSVNSGSPKLSVPGPKLPVRIGTSGRDPEQFSRTRARAQTAPTGTSGVWPELPVSTGTSGRRPEQNTRTRTRAGASDRNFRCCSPELPVQLTKTSGLAHQNFGPALQPTKLSSLALPMTQIKINGVEALESKRLLSIKI